MGDNKGNCVLADRLRSIYWALKKRYWKQRRKILGKIIKKRSVQSAADTIHNFFHRLAIRYVSRTEKVKDNRILFCTSRGTFNCNPKAVAEEIIRQGLPWELVWVVRRENLKKAKDYPPQLQLVVRNTLKFYKALASSKIWIDNSVNLMFCDAWKKPEQVLIETWHGSFGIKRFETSANKQWIHMAQKSGKVTDYICSNSDFEDELFRKTFWADSAILKYGHARNDILLPDNAERCMKRASEVRQRFNIADGVKIALYGPTYRDDQEDFSPYDIDYARLHTALTERFGGEWCILTRLHFLSRKLAKKQNRIWPEYVIDASSYGDIQDLITAADIGITDYSSWILDFVLTGKPGFLYVRDLQSFYTERGFYYPLTELPFPMAENDAGLEEDIRLFEQGQYQERVDAFLKRMGCMEDGHAAERLVEKLKEIICV